MIHFEKESLIICIENAAAFISETGGYETVSAAFDRCGVCDLYKASESELWDVFGDLDFIQNELRSG